MPDHYDTSFWAKKVAGVQSDLLAISSAPPVVPPSTGSPINLRGLPKSYQHFEESGKPTTSAKVINALANLLKTIQTPDAKEAIKRYKEGDPSGIAAIAGAPIGGILKPLAISKILKYAKPLTSAGYVSEAVKIPQDLWSRVGRLKVAPEDVLSKDMGSVVAGYVKPATDVKALQLLKDATTKTKPTVGLITDTSYMRSLAKQKEEARRIILHEVVGHIPQHIILTPQDTNIIREAWRVSMVVNNELEKVVGPLSKAQRLSMHPIELMAEAAEKFNTSGMEWFGAKPALQLQKDLTQRAIKDIKAWLVEPMQSSRQNAAAVELFNKLESIENSL